MTDTYLVTRYGQAVQFLPPRFRTKAMEIDDEIKCKAREFRLRVGEQMTVLTAEQEINIPYDSVVRHEDLDTVLDIATGGSVHSSAESIKAGFLTVPGGHRIGICGTGVYHAGEVSFIKNISSVTLRIAKEFNGISNEIYDEIMQNGEFENTIIISPPGCGKTTMLRDLIRNLSDGERAYRISIADERSEIAAKYHAIPQFYTGHHTDIMEALPKADAMMLMLRSMSPEIIAVDEITAEEDIHAMECVTNCGVSLLATAHGYDAECLFARPLYKRLYELDIFRYAVVLGINNGEYTWYVEEL